MRTTATNRVMEMISEYCTDSDESGLLKNLMFDAIESKLDVQRKQLTLNLLERLWRKGVGTNQVEDMVKNFRFGGGRMLSADKARQEKEKMIREGLRKKIRNFLGIFPKCRTPPPHPPLLGISTIFCRFFFGKVGNFWVILRCFRLFEGVF